MRRISFIGITSLLLAAGCLLNFSDSHAIDSGLWEMNMETKMEGLPFAMPPSVVTIKHCVTEKDLFPKDPNAKNCTFKNQKITGNKVSWEYECNEDGSKAVGKGDMSYSGGTCSGTSKTTITAEGNTVVATTKMKGKRLGKCNGEGQSISVNGQELKNIEE